MRRISGIDDGDIFPPFKLTGERYVWEVDRTRRIIRLLSRDGEKTLCCCGVEFPILTAALDGDTLYALPGNGTDLRKFHAFPLPTEAETAANGTERFQDVACTTSSSVNAVSVSSEGS